MTAVRRWQSVLLVGGVLAAAAVTAFAVWRPAAPPEGRRPALQKSLPPLSPEAAVLQTTGLGLHQVRVGMPRAEVEAAVGRPGPPDTSPVVRVGGRSRYRTTYQAYLAAPVAAAPGVRGYCTVVLEYDADRPGHPLVGVSCTPMTTPAGLPAELPVPLPT